MSTSTITAKCQLTLPKDVRDHLGVTFGDRLDFLIEPDGKVTIRRLGRNVDSLYGILHRPGMPPVTLEEIDESIADYLTEDDDRIRRQWHR